MGRSHAPNIDGVWPNHVVRYTMELESIEKGSLLPVTALEFYHYHRSKLLLSGELLTLPARRMRWVLADIFNSSLAS